MRARACAPTLAIVAIVVGGCGHPVKPQVPPAIRIVATERGPSGGRLVVIDEAGLRTAELVPAAVETARDNSAIFSPDGAWIAFASSRGRGESLEHTSLWVVAAQLDALPVRVTDDKGDDLAPAWTPDGHALVFASDRGGSLDLWRVPLGVDGGRMRAAGPLVQLTRAPGAELAPSIASDGTIAFASIAKQADGSRTSRIEVLDARGEIHAITEGPGDGSPAWSPDGKTIAFSAPVGRGTTIVMPDGSKQAVIDADLFAVDADGGHRRVLVDAPGTDESGPVWSHDGRWLFATSLARSVRGKPLLSSIVYVDLRATPQVVRMLREPSAPVSRLAPALAPGPLDDDTLAAGPGYQATLEQIMIHAANKREEEAAP